MSVYGGDSWGREAQQRKRRVDDLITQEINDKVGPSTFAGQYKKLTNGKYACLVCPHHPVLDSPLMLSMHLKGSRHKAADSRFKERELLRGKEIGKRLASSDCFPGNSCVSSGNVRVPGKPLLERTRKAAAEEVVVSKEAMPQNHLVHTRDTNSNRPSNTSTAPPVNGDVLDAVSAEHLAQWKLDLREHRERELKFIEAGWKRGRRDGRWYRDENAEFDSDEEDPNVVLYQTTGSSS